MKYIDALKRYNEGKDKWCMPRKGSEDYLNIIKMVKKVSKIKKTKGIVKDAKSSKDADRKIKILQAAIKRKLAINKKIAPLLVILKHLLVKYQKNLLIILIREFF